MVDTSKKVLKIIEMIDKGKYFIINRPRQYGKTTTLSLLYQRMITISPYLVIRTSFEGLGEQSFESEISFCIIFTKQIAKALNRIPQCNVALEYIKETNQPKTFIELNNFITNLINTTKQKIILMIDEVDKASNHIVFLNFLGMLKEPV